jgi:hypothetical protein
MRNKHTLIRYPLLFTGLIIGFLGIIHFSNEVNSEGVLRAEQYRCSQLVINANTGETRSLCQVPGMGIVLGKERDRH